MRPLFVNRTPFPVRTHFSAFRFPTSKAGTKGVSRAAVKNPYPDLDLSGSTLTSIGLKPLARNYSLKFDNENITLASQGAFQDHDEESSPHGNEPPWGHNVGSRSGYQDWQLDVIPEWTSLESGIRADGRLAKWAVL